MIVPVRMVAGAVSGAVVGIAVVVILCATTIVTALLGGRAVSVPWVFSASPSSFEGSLAVEFVPNSAGMLAVTCLAVAIGTLLAVIGMPGGREARTRRQ